MAIQEHMQTAHIKADKSPPEISESIEKTLLQMHHDSVEKISESIEKHNDSSLFINKFKSKERISNNIDVLETKIADLQQVILDKVVISGAELLVLNDTDSAQDFINEVKDEIKDVVLKEKYCPDDSAIEDTVSRIEELEKTNHLYSLIQLERDKIVTSPISQPNDNTKEPEKVAPEQKQDDNHEIQSTPTLRFSERSMSPYIKPNTENETKPDPDREQKISPTKKRP